MASTKQDTDNTTEKNAQKPPQAAIPDGGYRAWLQVVGSFFLFFCTWGLVNAFGAWEAFYRTDFLNNYSASAISWVGSVQGALLVFGGVIAGPIFDRGYFREMLVLGSLMVVFGMMMLSLADKYYQVLLAQGFCVGIGSSILYIPSLALVASSFQKRRGLAISIATSGASLGGVIFLVMFRRLQPRIGFSWATRTIAFVQIFCFLISWVIMLPEEPIKPQQPRKLLDSTAWKSWPFVAFTIAGFFAFLAYFVPFFYITPFAQVYTDAGESLSFYMLAIVNGVSFSRIIVGQIADIIGGPQTLVITSATAGVVILAWISVHSVPGLIVWAIVWGFLGGILVSIPASIVPLLCPSREVIGTRLGICWGVAAIAILVGNPIAGSLASADLSTFSHAQGFAGGSMLLGCIGYAIAGAHIIRSKK